MTIEPLVPMSIDPWIAALPKADVHLHGEAEARLERLIARQHGHPLTDRRRWAQHIFTQSPPGLGRLTAIYAPDQEWAFAAEQRSDPEEDFIARVADVLEDGAKDGAVLIEVRYNPSVVPSSSGLMPLFREAERRVRHQYPQLRAEAIAYVSLANHPDQIDQTERQLAACLRAAREGLGGVDFRLSPYDTEADPSLWATTYHWAERAREVGLGITVHAGEFSPANLAAALRVPGLQRIGHAVYAAADPWLLEQLVGSGATVECSLTCNVILGAVPAYAAHPIRQFVALGIPVTLCTDLPIHVCTTIGQEYAIAAALGFSPAELLAFTRNAVQASFTSAARRRELIQVLHHWETGRSTLD